MLPLFAACTADYSPATPAGDLLPPDTYPLQIASLTIAADGQPGTRLADNGNTTSWQPGDQVMVSLGDRQAIYTYNADTDTWQSDAPLYWQSKAPQTVNAWYPVTAEIDFTQQNIQGLTYLLKADPVSATYGQEEPVNLTFHHQLAKVRVVLEGAKAQDVATVTVRSYPKSVNDKGALGDRTGGDPIYVPMLQTTYEGQPCWEATLRSGTLQADDSFKVAKEGGNPMQVVLDKNISIKAGEVYTINIQVNEPKPVTGEISDDNTYIVSGTREEPVNITGGNPTIYLENANISVNSGNAISITGDANATIHITGNNTVQNTSYTIDGAGIYVEAGSTVTIEGTNRNTDVLTAIAANDAAGIGGNSNGQDCGNIHIHNVTVVAKGDQSTALSPGIGSTGNNNCGQIIIDNATVHAYGQGISGTAVCPAIGPGFSGGLKYGDLPMVTIRNESEVHAHRGGGNADYIGYPYKYGEATGAASTVNLGQGGTCTSSTIYCYTGESTDKEHIYFYDNQGNRTEQSQ